MKVRLKYVSEDTDRHGNVRLYYRRKGQAKIRLPGPVGSPAFVKAYDAADAGEVPVKRQRRVPAAPDTLTWLCEEYYRSAVFRRLDDSTQKDRRGILGRLCDAIGKDGKANGSKPYMLIEARHIRKWRDDRAQTPAAANKLLKALRRLFDFATEAEIAERNPARDVKNLEIGSQGFHSWTIEEVRQYEARHPVGTKARLAFALLLYTGVRRSDVVRLGRQHIRNGRLEFTQFKGRNRHPHRLSIKIIPQLQQIIDTSPCGDLTFLETAYGRPYTSNGFGNRFREWCDKAGLPQCSAHGMRKAIGARLAELGVSAHGIMSVLGHKSLEEAERYTRAASQRAMADSALDTLSEALSSGQEANESVPLSGRVAAGGTKTGAK